MKNRKSLFHVNRKLTGNEPEIIVFIILMKNAKNDHIYYVEKYIATVKQNLNSLSVTRPLSMMYLLIYNSFMPSHKLVLVHGPCPERPNRPSRIIYYDPFQ